MEDRCCSRSALIFFANLCDLCAFAVKISATHQEINLKTSPQRREGAKIAKETTGGSY
jgi:hypothetical protein